MAETEQVFGTHAARLRQAGFAVLPADGKRPLRTSFPKWKHPPGLATVEEWAEKDGGADVVYVPGLSRTKAGRPIIVFDADDVDARDKCIEIFGDTPGRINTRKAQHLLYEADPNQDLGKLHSLKRYGLNADLKHGKAHAGICVAPPSRHEKQPGFRYSWDRCDETVIRDLPPFDYRALERLIDNASPHPGVDRQSAATASAASHLRDGSRKLTINDRLVANVWSFSSESELLAAAFQLNHDIGCADPRGPLDADEVMTVARSVWNDREAGKLEKLAGAKSREKLHRQVLGRLSRLDPRRATDAYALFLVLCDEHAARCRRGETFAISPKRMAETNVIPEWDRRRYERARDLLLAAGLIAKVAEFQNTADGRSAAQFILTIHTGGAPAPGQKVVALGTEIVPGLLLNTTWGANEQHF